MAEEKSKKRIIIEISSSNESNSPPSESDDDAVEVISSPTSCNDDDWSEWNDSEDEDRFEVVRDEDWDTDDAYKPDAESMHNKVIQFIRDRIDLQELKLDECKAYLRRYNLRLSGTKEECIARIEEHWKSIQHEFSPTGWEMEVVKHSIPEHHLKLTALVMYAGEILFYSIRKSRKMARNKTVGWRTVAGRIIKESYGAIRQQHTFTVEVLWSRGDKQLEPLFPLLVKGRNLYKLKTFRQLWKNEKERLEVLAEKHRRGGAARAIRARRTKAVMRKHEPLVFKDAQHHQRFHHCGPSRTSETSRGKKKCLNEHGELVKSKKRIISRRFAPYSLQQNAGSRGSSPQRRHYNSPYQQGIPSPSVSYNYQAQYFFPTESHNFHSHGGFASIAGLPYCSHPYSSTRRTPSDSRSKNENEAASLNYPGLTSSHQSTTKRHNRR